MIFWQMKNWLFKVIASFIYEFSRKIAGVKNKMQFRESYNTEERNFELIN